MCCHTDQDESVVVCHTKTMIIDEHDNLAEESIDDVNMVDSPIASVRYSNILLARRNRCLYAFGVIRSCRASKHSTDWQILKF